MLQKGAAKKYSYLFISHTCTFQSGYGIDYSMLELCSF